MNGILEMLNTWRKVLVFKTFDNPVRWRPTVPELILKFGFLCFLCSFSHSITLLQMCASILWCPPTRHEPLLQIRRVLHIIITPTSCLQVLSNKILLRKVKMLVLCFCLVWFCFQSLTTAEVSLSWPDLFLNLLFFLHFFFIPLNQKFPVNKLRKVQSPGL